MSKPLTKRQITVLSIMAGKAYKRIQSQGCPLPSLTDWRHDEIWAATGVTESLTKATQEHYVPIYNRLASYLGEAPLKNRTWTEMDKAIHNLRDAMGSAMRQRWTIWRLLCATNCIYPAQVGLCTIPCEIMLPWSMSST